jgi:putative transposase
VLAVQALKAEFPCAMLLAIAGLARSTYFYHQARLIGPNPHAALDAAIQKEFARAKGRYGHRRIHRALCATGWVVARKTVLKRMHAQGLCCQVRRKRFTTYRGEVGLMAPNVLNRDFTATAPNQKWVTDVTEFRIGDTKLYVSPVMDLYDRQIIACTVARSSGLPLATSALRQAITTLTPTEHPLVHSDQGFHYQHQTWKHILESVGATPSMSRKGNCLDNAVIENFFGHLKSELLLEPFPDIASLEMAIPDYVHWYNHERTSERLKGLSPVQYRTQTLLA